MKKISRFAAIAAAATLALSLGACSKDEETKEPEDAPEVTQSAEEADVDEDAEAAEEAEEAEEEIDFPEFTEGEGVGPAHLDSGYVAFDVGSDVAWEISMGAARGDRITLVQFRPVDTHEKTSITVAPGWVNSMDEAVAKCREDVEATQVPIEDLGEVEINGVTYHKFAQVFEYNPPGLNLCTFHEPTGSYVEIRGNAGEMDSYDFEHPEVMDLLFDTLTFPEE